MSRVLITGGTIVNEGDIFEGYLTIVDQEIEQVGKGTFEGELSSFDTIVDAQGGYIMAGVIDDQVHFREPGLTYKADIASESRAAAAGGVTSYMEMPNTNPPTVNFDAWQQKADIAAENSVVNYSFYLGATNDNIEQIKNVDTSRVCGIKLFMGSSTGNMLVDREQTLKDIFSLSPLLVAVHAEEESIVRENNKLYKEKYGDSATAEIHPLIRSAEACYASSAKAVELATKYNGRLHILHISTQKEMSLLSDTPLRDKRITAEVCVHHLWFSEEDYKEKGNFIKWNPAIKSLQDREALISAVKSGKIDIVATDHAPHTLEEKQKPYFSAPSGGPLVQHSLVAMMQMYEKGIFSLGQITEKMSHAPAELFQVDRRGYLREGYYADIVILKKEKWVISSENILSKCGWSPLLGEILDYKVDKTIVNGTIVYDSESGINESVRGKELKFNR